MVKVAQDFSEVVIKVGEVTRRAVFMLSFARLRIGGSAEVAEARHRRRHVNRKGFDVVVLFLAFSAIEPLKRDFQSL